jgi:hypothetical protein
MLADDGKLIIKAERRPTSYTLTQPQSYKRERNEEEPSGRKKVKSNTPLPPSAVGVKAPNQKQPSSQSRAQQTLTKSRTRTKFQIRPKIRDRQDKFRDLDQGQDQGRLQATDHHRSLVSPFRPEPHDFQHFCEPPQIDLPKEVVTKLRNFLDDRFYENKDEPLSLDCFRERVFYSSILHDTDMFATNFGKFLKYMCDRREIRVDYKERSISKCYPDDSGRASSLKTW